MTGRFACLLRLLLALAGAFAISRAEADQSDHQAAHLLDLAASGEYSRNDWRAMQREIRNLPEAKLAETAKAVMGSGRRADISLAIDEICFVWGLKNPDAAMAFADSISDKTLRENCCRTALSGWAEADWKSARTWMGQQPPGQIQDLLATELIRTVAARNPKEALMILLEESSQGRHPQTWHIFAICARRDPLASVKAWEKLPPGGERNSARSSIARYWGEVQPEDAWQWASSLPEEKDRSDARESVILGALDTFPERAAALAKQPPISTRLLPRFVFEWARKDADAAAQWALGLPDDVKANVLLNILNRSNVSNQRALLEPLLSLPEGTDRARAVARVLDVWGGQNYEEAKTWLLKQPPGRDSLVFLWGLSRPLAEKDPELLLSLLAKIPEDQREAFLMAQLRTTIKRARPELLPKLPRSTAKGFVGGWSSGGETKEGE
jgi:hypothetical protein